MSNTSNKSKLYSMRLPNDLWDEIEKLKKEYKMDRTQVIKRLLVSSLEKGNVKFNKKLNAFETIKDALSGKMNRWQ
jgi:metal-responsive CopG/Arc/MetJ family transcriptional regulator